LVPRYAAGVELGVALSGEELQERRLAGAVRADDADALAATDEEIDALEEHASAARRPEILRVEDDVAGARRGSEAEADAVGDRPHVLGTGDAIELVEHLAAALRLP